MKCTECFDRIDDYLDGRLGDFEADKLRKHLETCSSCADELEAIRDVREQAGGLPSSLEPPRDLWPGIAARISGARVVRARFGRRALLAAAAAVVMVSSLVTAYFIGRSQALPRAVSPATIEHGPSEMLLVSFEGLGVDDFVATRSELLEALEARKHELSPETMEVVTENLELIDQAMNRIAEALGEDPENEFLMRQLAGAYRRQIDLLQLAIRLPAEV
jgi:anti-sigma factor RsiW